MTGILPEAVLPNGMKLNCLWEWEAKKAVLSYYEHVQAYFENGVELKEGDVVFDVGANIGLFMLSVYDRFKGKVKVYAFEPIPDTYNVLKENAARYDPENLMTFPYGISSRCGEIDFAYYPKAAGFSTVYPDQQENDTIKPLIEYFQHTVEMGDIEKWPSYVSDVKDENQAESGLSEDMQKRANKIRTILGVKSSFQPERVSCKIVTLSDIMEKNRINRIDLLKLHVEKSELDILSGINENDWAKIRQIVIQIEGGNIIEEVKKVLGDRGFKRILVSKQDSTEAFDTLILYAFRN